MAENAGSCTSRLCKQDAASIQDEAHVFAASFAKPEQLRCVMLGSGELNSSGRTKRPSGAPHVLVASISAQHAVF